MLPLLFEKMIPTQILGFKSMTMGSGEGSTMRNFRLCTVHLIVKVIKFRILRWVGHVAWTEQDMSAFKMLTGKPRRKKPLGRPRPRWEDNIRMDLKEIGVNTRTRIWLIRLRTEITGVPLWMQQWTSGFYKP